MLAAARAADMPRPDAVTHVPMHWRRRRARYFDQAELLAMEIAREWELVPEKLLVRARSCRSQANIADNNVRRENVRDAFRATAAVKGRRVLLIDDVYTTGATALDCARALKEAGAADIALLTYAIAHNADGTPLCDDGPQLFDSEELPF